MENEAARAAAFASQADRSRELAAGYVQQALANAQAIRAIKVAVDQQIAALGVPHRWTGTVLEIMRPDGQWGQAIDLRGLPGAAATIEIAETVTLEPGEDATVENVGSQNAAALVIGIPAGAAATIEIAETVTLEPGEEAAVENIGTPQAASLVIGIPAGAPGTIVVNDVATLPAGSSVTIENVGTPHNAVLNIGIPAGNDGEGSGTVTSVGLSMPTGFSVGSSPVSVSGTFEVTYATGYQAYTTAEAGKLANITVTGAVNLDTLASTVAAKAPIASPTFTGTVTLPGDPASNLQAATKQYVDNAVVSLAKKFDSVRAATTANITISTALNNGDTLDGVTLATGDLVLVKNQSTASQNGIYVVGVSPARATAFDAWDELIGALVSVQEGTVNADTGWLCTSNKGGTLGSTAVVYTKANFTGEMLAANNLSDLANAATARQNLDLEVGVDVQAYNAKLDGLAGQTWAADQITYQTGASTVGTTALSAFARTLLDDPDQATMKATLGISSAETITQIGGNYSTTSGSAVSVTSIPSGYKALIIRLNSVGGSANAAFTVAVSQSNGASYGTGRAIVSADVVSTTTITGQVRIDGISESGAYKAITSHMYSASAGASGLLNVETNITGIIDAVRLATPTGTFDAGSFTVWGVS